MAELTPFPHDFTWGAATSSYQIEGAHDQDHKGLSVWDTFCQQPNKIWNDHTGKKACSHFKHFQKDITLMKKIGLKAYRFSLSWPRILPKGIGNIHSKGIAFYDQLIDELLKYDIEPYITLFHWDYPLALYQKGGWLNPESPDWFEEYTQIACERFSDRVQNWITMNEPQCFIHLGHQTGYHAPGCQLEFHDILKAAHHTLLAHGKSVQMMRQINSNLKIGISTLSVFSIPQSHHPMDRNLAYHNSFQIKEKNLWNNSWWMVPFV